MAHLLEVDNLEVKFGLRHGDLTAINGISFSLDKGERMTRMGLRGRFGVYIPPLMEALGLCELEHNPKNNRMRAK